MRRTTALRTSILVSLGIIPLACGGSVRDGSPDSGYSGQGAATGQNGPGKQLPPTGSGGRSSGGSVPIGAGMPTTGVGAGGSLVIGVGASPGIGTGGSFPIGTAGAPIGTGGTFSTGTGGTATRFPCSGKFRPDTGLVECAEGYSHRPILVECVPLQDDPSYGGAGGEGGTDNGLCQSDQDCRGYAWGYCGADGAQTPTTCHSGCVSDLDCGPGAICECGSGISPSGGVCRPSNCRTNADCGPGLLCASYQEFCGQRGFACQKPNDQCASGRECGAASCYLDIVAGGTSRICASVDCGRPFLVEQQMRMAPTVGDDAWSPSLDDEPDVASLSAFERAAQAARFSRMGQLEHASIAAFARFSLQLLSLGAPPELVEACTSALADETAHAKLCFRLASAYAGHAVGPGPLDVTNSLSSTSLGEIVELVIAEGCFGETIATLDAQEAAEQASDPVIAAAFARIARDEQRHAELAFGFLRWALEREPALVRRRIAEATESSFEHSSGAREVVVPCLLALLHQARAA